MEFFNTTAGVASIISLIFAVLWFIIDRSNKKEGNRIIKEGQMRSEEGQKRLETLISDGNKRLEISIVEGNKRLETSNADGYKRLETSIIEGNRRLEASTELTRQMMNQMDVTTKEILKEIIHKVA